MQKKPKTEINKNQDVLEAYPTRLFVNALPERRFFRMTRALTIINALSVCLLITLAFFFYYAMDHQDTDIRYASGRNALYRLDPETKTLRQIGRTAITASPLEFLMEELLIEYIKARETVVADQTEMARRCSNGRNLNNENQDEEPGLVLLVSPIKAAKPICDALTRKNTQLRDRNLIRDVHIYGLKRVYQNLWTATLDFFDLPLTKALKSACSCQDNSQECLACKEKNYVNHQRFKLWARIGRAKESSWSNPFGLSIDSYSLQELPILESNAFWGLPAELQPKL